METAQSPATVSCPRCQTANAPLSRFCSLCGQPMQGGVVPPVQPPQPPPPPPVNRGMFLAGGAPGAPFPYDGDLPTAFAAAVGAIQAAGGTLTWQAAPQSARFELVKKDTWNTGGMKVRYEGELTVAAQGPRQSLVRLSLKPGAGAMTPTILINVMCTLVVALMSGPFGGLWLLLGIASTAWSIYKLSSRLPADIAEKIQQSLPAAGMAAPAGYAAPAYAAPASAPAYHNAPAGPVNGQAAAAAQGPAAGGAASGTAGVVEQLKQLAELKNVGAITPEEFEAKKAGLLARL